MFFCSAGLEASGVVCLRTPIGASDADMKRSVRKWSAALGSLTSAEELLGPMAGCRFRDIVRATVPLLDTVQHLRLFVLFACANPVIGDLALCAEIQRGCDSCTGVTKPVPTFEPAESALGIVLMTTSAAQLTTVMRVIETLNAIRAGVYALAAPLARSEMQSVAWHQTDDDLRLLREREAHARTCGVRLREPPVATRSLALFPDQCGLVCASMRNCAPAPDNLAACVAGCRRQSAPWCVRRPRPSHGARPCWQAVAVAGA